MSFPGQSGFDASTGPAERRDFLDLRRRVSALEENSDNGGGGDSGGGEGGGIPEAPLDGQQYGRQSAAWSVIELDDGEHVLTGDPENPPAELDAGQLLWDGVEGGSGSGGGGGPHDHAEYALVEHDHDEFTHDHADYLPLTGGTVTGELEVAGNSNLVVKASSMRGLVLDRTADENVPGLVEFMPSYQAGATTANVKVDGNVVARFRGDQLAWMYGDLQVDGNLTVKAGGGASNPAIAFNGIDGMGIYSSAASNYMRFGVAGGQRLAIKETVVLVNDNLQVNGTITGTLAFNIADGIDTRDVLDRAETAVMPALDDEGVTTTDAGVESVTVNEVVTALLAKVKQLSAEIEELKKGA